MIRAEDSPHALVRCQLGEGFSRETDIIEKPPVKMGAYKNPIRAYLRKLLPVLLSGNSFLLSQLKKIKKFQSWRSFFGLAKERQPLLHNLSQCRARMPVSDGRTRLPS